MVLVLTYVGLAGALWFLWRKDPGKTRATLKAALSSFRKIAPSMLAILGFIGITFALMPPDAITTCLGAGSGWTGTAIAAAVGSITLLPGIVAFPLAGSLLDSGASVTTAAVFISTMTMVGMVTLPSEAKEFGWKMAITRNLLALMLALLIGVVMGGILG